MLDEVLTNLEYQTKGPKNLGFLLRKGWLGEQKHFNKKGKSIPYISWNEKILSDKGLKKALSDMKTQPGKDKGEAKKPFKFDRSTFKAEFRTADGHFVRSKAEVIIDDFLFQHGLVHAYEKRVPIKEELYSDFFIPTGGGKGVYIEFWGLEDTKYIDRKKKKLELYKKYNLALISLSEEDVKNIDDLLPIKLLEHGISVL